MKSVILKLHNQQNLNKKQGQHLKTHKKKEKK